MPSQNRRSATERTPDEAFAEAERRIAAASRKKSINLSELGLVRVPESIGQLTQLELVNLHGNRLISMPESLRKLDSLRNLAVTANQLTVLPEWIHQLTNLELLYVGGNQLTEVPKSLGELVQLRDLVLWGNQITSLPESIGQLINLRGLDLHRNQIRALPESIGELAHLQLLDMSANQLSELPESIGHLTQLHILNLAENRFKVLPESLRHLRWLSRLFLHHNPGLRLPASVLGPDWQQSHEQVYGPSAGSILDYYFRTRVNRERRPLREAKLILVGRGEVGKTSLVKRLVENKFSRREDRTQGIRITMWPLAVKRTEEVRMHVWDFGGQEIMHATHQFFLTDRSVYMLVLDGRGGLQEAEAATGSASSPASLPNRPCWRCSTKSGKTRST